MRVADRWETDAEDQWCRLAPRMGTGYPTGSEHADLGRRATQDLTPVNFNRFPVAVVWGEFDARTRSDVMPVPIQLV